MSPTKAKHHHKHHQKQQRPPPSDVTETMNEIQDGLRVLFADSVKKVKGVADGVETRYITPLANTVGSFASGSPVIFTFLAFFSVFSAIPLFIALGIITFLISMLLGALLAVLLTVSIGILMIAGFILTPILAFTAFTSFLATSSLVGLFLTTRLYLCIKKAGLSNVSDGILDWIEETRLRLFLGLGLASEGRSNASYHGLPDPQEETQVVAHVVSSTATTLNRETKERQEVDHKTQVRHQDHPSPSQIVLELVEVHGRSNNNNVQSAPPTSDVSFLQDRTDINVIPAAAPSLSVSTDRVQGWPPRSADTDDWPLRKDAESTLAQEVGVN